MAAPTHAFLAFLALLALVSRAAHGGSFTLTNNCGTTVWVATESNAGVAPLSLGQQAVLGAGKSLTVSTPDAWGGRFWGRTGCAFDASGNAPAGAGAAVPGGISVTCATGDCGPKLECFGTGGKPPATLAEFTLAGYHGQDYYDVSLVDGYNLPLAVFPTGGGTSGARNASDEHSCTAAGCTGDLNRDCPSALRLTGSDGSTLGCRSACDVFRGSQYCCTGANGTPDTCPPTDYSRTFKRACPKAYSYAYDDKSSTFICRGGAYSIVFCPTSLPDPSGGSDDPSLGAQNPGQLPSTPVVPPLTPDVPSLTPEVPSLTPEVPSLTPDVPSLTPEVPTLTPEVPTMDAPPTGGASGDGIPSVGGDGVPSLGGEAVPDGSYTSVGTNFHIVTDSSDAAATALCSRLYLGSLLAVTLFLLAFLGM